MKGLENNHYFILSTESKRIFCKYNREYELKGRNIIYTYKIEIIYFAIE